MSKYLSLSKKVSLISIMVSLFSPTLVFAEGVTLGSIFAMLTSTLLVPLGGLLITAIFVVFVWGLVKYVYSLGEKEKVEGRWMMVWGIIALFVMASAWGLVRAINETLGIDDSMNTPVKSIVIP